MDPWKPLRRIGWIAVALGVLDLSRFLRPDEALVLDVPSISASFICGWALLRRRSIALLSTTTAGGVIIADALVSVVLIGPRLWQTLVWQLEIPFDRMDGDALSLAVSGLLLYGFQILFWPYAAARVMKDQEAAGIPKAYAHHTRETVIASFFVCGLMSLVVQMWAKAIVYRLV